MLGAPEKVAYNFKTLVRTLGLSDKTPPGLPGLKPSSNSVLPVAWITRPATDLRQGKTYSNPLS